MKKLGVVVLVAGMAIGSVGCCKKGSESSSGADPAATGTATGAATGTATATGTEAKPLVWNMDLPCASTKELKITQISVVGDETLVKMRYDNEKGTGYIQTAPAGTKETFFLENHDGTKKISLKRSEGIAVSPAKTQVKGKQTVEFTIVFPAIDASWGPIDIHEGEVKKKGMTYWNWEKIPLK